MRNTQTIIHWGIVSVCTGAILYLFFVQARVAMKPIPIVFEPTSIAYGYTVSTFTGTIYHDEGTTPVGAGSGVSMTINGTATGTVTTNTNGLYTFENKTIRADDVVSVYLSGEPEDAVLVAKFSSGEISDELITGMNLYHDRLIVRTSTGDLSITETNLRTAGKVGSDVFGVFTATGNLILAPNAELYVWENTTYTASGNTYVHDLEVNGTFDAGSSSITVSGSLVAGGTLTTTGDVTLTSYASGEILQVSSSLQNLYLDTGMQAYFRMDEGTGLNASGATLSTQTGGSISGAEWVTTTSGTTLFYNPYALEFDGTDDKVTFGDNYDITDSSQKTFTAWIRRKSANTEDVILAKKNGSGVSLTGYMLFIDDETDKLYFEVANGTNNYLVESTSTITDQDWHHIALSYNPNNTNATNLYIDGAIDTGAKSGSLASGGELTGTFANALEFTVGTTSDTSEPFEGTIDDIRIYARSMSGSQIARLGAGRKATGSGTYYLSGALDVNNNLSLIDGTLDVGSGYSITVGGNYAAYAGTLHSNSGSFILDGSTQRIFGSTAFHRLTKTVSTTLSLLFEANTEQTVSGSLVLNGTTSNRLSLDSTRSGSQSYLRVDDIAVTTLKFLNVQDNNATGGLLLSCTAGCVDGGNNVNWEFLNECGDGIIGGSEQCDDGDNDNFDVCPNDCRFPVCGDDVVEGLEECEPPSVGACKSNCLFRTSGGGGGAGGGTFDPGGPYYKRPVPPDGCGNGVVDTDKGEECDAGTRFNGLGSCSYDCKQLSCGDGTISPHIGEDCEPKVKGTRNGKKIFEVGLCGEVCTAPEYTSTGTPYGGCKTKNLPACNGNGLPQSDLPDGFCGNGTIDKGEECDFGSICKGGRMNGTILPDATTVNMCVIQGGRPSPTSGDGCNNVCKTEFCGDGVLQPRGADNQDGTADDEECDNGSICSDTGDSCRLDSDCTKSGMCNYNAEKDQFCGENCKKIGKPSAPTRPTEPAVDETGCGDGIIQAEEQCDAGSKNSDILSNSCRTNCRLPVCGDFVIDKGEECDDGSGNSDTTPNACRSDCTLPICGDGIVDLSEQCDGGASCQTDCIFASEIGQCGNGIVERGEQCDDNNTLPNDGCSRFCQREEVVFVPAICGNGFVETPEECDDGNLLNGDTCSSVCKQTTVMPVGLVLDADIVIVNPVKIAEAISFVDSSNPCARLTAKGLDDEAESIRNAAKKQGIPIVQNIALAKSIYNAVEVGEMIVDPLCTQVQLLKPTKHSAPIDEEVEPLEIIFANNKDEPAIPEDPMLTATITESDTRHAPVGDTGPATAAIIVTGLAGGATWARRKRI